MKIILILFAGILSLQQSFAQLKTTPTCPIFVVDVLEGTVNESLFTYSGMAEIEKKFPCYSSAKDETNGSTCGGVFYKEKDIYFYTERDYIEIGEHFKGKLSLPLIGASRSSLFSQLGNPQIKDVSWDAYQTKYGILILYYNKAGKINKIQFSNRSTESIKLCE
jgi:hypothetical protein